MSDIEVDICYRLPGQEKQVDEVLYRQVEAISHLQELVLVT